MGKVLNFWTESEAIDTFFYIYEDTENYDNFIKYLEEWAPWLLKHKDRIWYEINM